VNGHPLGFLLNKKRRHVWCAIRGEQFWTVYDWHVGIPVISVADRDIDLAAFYTGKGCEVIEIERGTEACHGPWMCNNCVGHTMVMAAIRAHLIFTPQQLWNHLTGNSMRYRAKNFFRRACYMPGFGSKTQAAPLPPPPVRAPKSETTIAADKKLAADEVARLAARKKSAGGATASEGTLLDDDDTIGAGALK